MGSSKSRRAAEEVVKERQTIDHLWELNEAMRCFVRAAAALSDLRRLTADSKGAALLWAAKGLIHLTKTDSGEQAVQLAVEALERVVRERAHGRAEG